MVLTDVLLLLGTGLAAGYVAGLIGVGGGIIFAPVLLFYYGHLGVAPEVLAQLTVGSSLLCTLVAALASAWFQRREGAVLQDVAVRVGTLSAVAIFLMTRYVTTRPWYDATTFQVVFSLVLLVVVARMVLGGRRQRASTESPERSPRRHSWPLLGLTGTAAGTIAAAAGVGGGIVLVPTYHGLLHLPIHQAVGTSSATIVLISFFGVLNYAALGLGQPVPETAVGYVDVGRALVLAVPAIASARLGVWTAHRFDTAALRWSFAVVAAVVAVRLLFRALA